MKLHGFIVLAASFAAPMAFAANYVVYDYTFSAADLLNNVFVAGVDGSTPVQNNLLDGARLLRTGEGTPMHRTYVESQQDTFKSRWQAFLDNDWVFDDFNLWGLDGLGAGWGEDFKPFEIVGFSSPAGWGTYSVDWPWGTPPAGYLTDDIVGWVTDDKKGILLDATNLADLKFTARIKFDTDNMWWNGVGDPYRGSLNNLTMWFGGYIHDGKTTAYPYGGNYHLYEGNMQVTGVPVPEPMTLGLAGLALVAAFRRRRRN